MKRWLSIMLAACLTLSMTFAGGGAARAEETATNPPAETVQPTETPQAAETAQSTQTPQATGEGEEQSTLAPFVESSDLIHV